MNYLQCPLRACGWQAAYHHLGNVVVVADRGLETVDALEQMHGELLAHIRDDHLAELQLMVAGASGGRGEPVTCNVVQHVDARQIDGAGDLVLTVLVPQMRARLAREMATRGLRPLDPWPAVQVRRYVWTSDAQWRHQMLNGTQPPGMRSITDLELNDGRAPDLYQLELRTGAVPDTRTVEL